METLLGNKVAYLDYPLTNQELIRVLGLKNDLIFEDFLVEFKKWRNETEFSTTLNHICEVYHFLKQVNDKKSCNRQHQVTRKKCIYGILAIILHSTAGIELHI